MREIPYMNGIPSKRVPADLNPFCEVRKHVYIKALEDNATLNTLLKYKESNAEQEEIASLYITIQMHRVERCADHHSLELKAVYNTDGYPCPTRGIRGAKEAKK